MTRLLLAACLLLAGCGLHHVGDLQGLAIVRGAHRTERSVVIEVDWTTPSPPPQSVLDAVRASLLNIVDPSVTVDIVLDQDLSRPPWDLWDWATLRWFEACHKSVAGGTFYLIWAHGEYLGPARVGGFSWNPRSFSVFPGVVGTSGDATIAIVHEWLHCIGLVGRGLKMQDGGARKVEGSNHCRNSMCIMGQVLRYGSPCGDCLADLTAGEVE